MGRLKHWMIAVVLAFGLTIYGCGGGGGGTSSGGTSSGGGWTSLTALLGSGSSGSKRTISNGSSIGKVVFKVDQNCDGSFGNDDKLDLPFDNSTAQLSARFKISCSKTKAYVKIEKNGYAPYEKVVDVSVGGNITFKPTFTPVKTAYIDNSTISKAGGPLIIGISKSGKPFVSSNLRASSHSQFSVEIPDNVSSKIVNSGDLARINYFSGTQRDAFPGNYEGYGYPASKASGTSNKIKSVAFSYLKITDTNGNEVSLPDIDQPKRDGTCSGYEYNLSVPPTQVGLLKDVDSTESGYQVPVWAFIDGKWQYLGNGDLYYYDNGTPVSVDENATLDNNTDYYVDFCSTRFYTWVNLDYVVYTKPLHVCVNIKYQDNGTEVGANNIDVEYVTPDGSFSDRGYTDSKGKIDFDIPVAKDNISHVRFYYSDSSVGEYNVPILATPEADNTNECDYVLNYTIVNKLDAKINVTVLKDDNKTPIEHEYVDAYSIDGKYYAWGWTDKDGKVVLNAKGGETYIVEWENQYKQESITANEVINITFTEKNNPPDVSIWASTLNAMAGKPVTVNASAFDYDGDKVSFVNATWGGKNVNPDYLNCSGYICNIRFDNLTTENPGNVTLTVTFKDSRGKEAQKSITIAFAQNRPPVITDVTGPRQISLNANGNTVTYDVWAYDLDGDELTYSVSSQNCSQNQNVPSEFNCNFTGEGTDNLTFTVSDSKATVSKTITVTVVGDYPPKIWNAYFDNASVMQGGKVTLTAEVEDIDSNNITLNIDSKLATGSTNCSAIWPGYYQCSKKIDISDNTSNGIYPVVIYASDGTKNSDNFTLNLRVANNPPEITKPLEDITVNAGESHTFSIEAYDPDNDSLTYTWYVDGQKKQSSGSNQFTYTFIEAKTYRVKVVVSDGINEVSSTSIVTVAGASASNTLKFNLGLEGITVALLDNNLKIEQSKTKTTDASGIVEFDNLPTSTVNVAFIASPDVVLTKELVFMASLKPLMYLYDKLCTSNCSYKEQDVNEWECKQAIPVDFLEKINDNQSISTILPTYPTDSDIENCDKNGDGYLSPDEFFKFAIKVFDKNNDGKIEVSEIAKNQNIVETTIFKELPVKDYTMAFGGYAISGYWFSGLIPTGTYDEGWGYYYSLQNGKCVKITMNNTPPYKSFNIEPTDAMIDNGQNAPDNVTTYAFVPLANDNTYSLIIVNNDNGSFLTLKDISKDNDSIVIDYSNASFDNPSIISLSNAKEDESLSMGVVYKGVDYELGDWDYGSGNHDHMSAINPGFDNANYYMDFRQDTEWGYSFVDNIKLDSFQQSVDLSNYESKLLDVSIALSGDDNNTVKLSGTDVGDVDEVDISKWYDTMVLLNDHKRVRYEYIENIYAPYGNKDINIANPEYVLPKKIYDDYVKAMFGDNVTVSESVSATAIHYENFSWPAMGDVGEESSVERNWWWQVGGERGTRSNSKQQNSKQQRHFTEKRRRILFGDFFRRLGIIR